MVNAVPLYNAGNGRSILERLPGLISWALISNMSDLGIMFVVFAEHDFHQHGIKLHMDWQA